MLTRTLLLSTALIAAVVPVRAQTPDTTSVDSQPLRAGDVIRLRIWREPDMSGDFNVDETGTVVFPRVGEYQVFQDTPETLKSRLLEDYRVYLRNPSIDVIVLRRIRITGAVNDPGLHLVDPTITVGDALAMAGGPTTMGQPDRIRIVRDGQQIAVDIRSDMRLADSLIRSGDQIVVPERSWVSRNAPVVAATITATVSLMIALFIR